MSYHHIFSRVFALVESIVGELLSYEVESLVWDQDSPWDLDFFTPICFPFVLFQICFQFVFCLGIFTPPCVGARGVIRGQTCFKSLLFSNSSQPLRSLS